jgi:tRNA(fMet)-specific endonuclease VapC
MKRLLMDTCIYSLAFKGEASIVDILQKADLIGISSISIGELLSGFKAGGREKKNREELDDFLDSPRVAVYGVDEETAEYYADILKKLRDIGKPVPTNDIWIAACAVQNGLKLFTVDNHFTYIKNLTVIGI